MQKTCAVLLAAGDGKRMKSARPKVLCEVLFKPMIRWVADCCVQAGIPGNCAVLGFGAELVKEALPAGFKSVLQNERKGTGHAAMMAAAFIRECGAEDVAVLCGDAPFITPKDLLGAYELHKTQGNKVTVLSARVSDPAGYGRIVREGAGVTAIVEHGDADEDTLEINEINSGAYWFNAAFLLQFFENMQCHNAQGEYYLTDTVHFAVKGAEKAGAYVAHPHSVLGANSRKGLQELNRIARISVLERLMEDGVSIPFADGIVVGADVRVGRDTVLLPGTILRGNTIIGEDCEIGPNSYLENAVVGNDCRIISTFIESSTLEDGVKIGPMSNVRPGCHISAKVKVGDFVELKNSNIGEKTAVAHLTYVGDSDVGAGCNFGCGVVTVNYDGTHKCRTQIGDGCFIGCNTNLIAPVKLGDRVYSAAGTTITEDVPDDALVIGRARQTVKEDWCKQSGLYRKK